MTTKKVIAALICLTTLLLLLPATASAADVSADDIGDITGAQDGDYIRLASPITFTGADDVSISNKSLTIDLNGYTLALGVYQLIFEGASSHALTITDTSAAGGGKLTSSNRVYNTGTGLATGGTITVKGSATLNIQGKCTVENTNFFAIYTQGSAPVNMTAGTVRAANGDAIYHNGSGAITITGGNVEGMITLKSGAAGATILSLSNCTVTCSKPGRAAIENLGPGKVIVGTGSTVKGVDEAIHNGKVEAGIIEISGGSVDVTGTHDDEALQFSVIQNDEHGTLTMTAGSVTASGQEIAIVNYGTCHISGGTVTSEAGVTIDNSNDTASATIGGTAHVESTGYRALGNDYGGDLIINNGCFIRGGGRSAIANSEGTVTINGGTVEGAGVTAIQNGGNSSPAVLTIHGGTIRTTGAQAYTIEQFVNSAVSVADAVTLEPEGKMYPATVNPAASITTAQLSGGIVGYTLSNSASYSANTRFAVFDAATGGNLVSNVGATYNTATGVVTLSGTGLAAGAYHLAAYDRGLGKGYSTRLTLTVTAPAQSATPTAAITTVHKTAAVQASVSFTLTNSPAISGTWKAYGAAAGGSEATGITASASGSTLTLTHTNDIPAATYYIAVTEAGKSESVRLALTVGAMAAPTVTSVTVDPDAVSVRRGDRQAFSAAVAGENSPATTVSWRVTGQTSSTTDISTGGVLTVGRDETAAALTVTATSTVDTSKSGTATVRVAGGPTISDPTADRTVPVTVGRSITLSVNAPDAAVYQWQQSMDGGSSWRDIAAAGASYTTSPVSLSNNGYQYRCIVTGGNDERTISPVFTLNVTEPVEVPVTGDSAVPGLWIGIMLMAGMALALNAVPRREKRNQAQ